jgi:hypothetical protein
MNHESSSDPCCPLCSSDWLVTVDVNSRQFYDCRKCGGISLAPGFRLGEQEERARYELHQNDVTDPGYQLFVRPMVEAIGRDFRPGHSGLDYGAGPGPVITELLKAQGFQINLFDPYFHPDTSVLNQSYDYIFCCEVIEHFYFPTVEFARLKAMLKPGGKLYCMTHVFSKDLDFTTWYYKNDPTHVFIYRKETFDWIARQMGFSDVVVEGRLIGFFNDINPDSLSG